jgi:hypothetical protein
MMRPVRHRLLSALLVALAAACTYDWTVGPSPVGQQDGGALDATAGDVAVPDGPAPPPADGGADAPAPPPPLDCNEAGTALPELLAAAKICKSQPGECTTVHTDECGCKQVLAEANAAAGSYIGAVAAYLDASCMTVFCPSPPTCPTNVTTGLCIANGDGGTSCSQ